ncbi:hypothetical protein LX64_04503 [Chitinophaga skermanii]|uniref:Uncharacterized protein n=1 Tax=Chitinophaga skermanii TaxID=331697 RepID=A0A327Q7Z4_9BACT|nr:hypothetical protein [Chitinophaga skermanii]RAI99372.1 hypothetical protein LX64_04503 [Chitinophaga skermanii]
MNKLNSLLADVNTFMSLSVKNLKFQFHNGKMFKNGGYFANYKIETTNKPNQFKLTLSRGGSELGFYDLENIVIVKKNDHRSPIFLNVNPNNKYFNPFWY